MPKTHLFYTSQILWIYIKTFTHVKKSPHLASLGEVGNRDTLLFHDKTLTSYLNLSTTRRVKGLSVASLDTTINLSSQLKL